MMDLLGALGFMKGRKIPQHKVRSRSLSLPENRYTPQASI